MPFLCDITFIITIKPVLNGKGNHASLQLLQSPTTCSNLCLTPLYAITKGCLSLFSEMFHCHNRFQFFFSCGHKMMIALFCHFVVSFLCVVSSNGDFFTFCYLLFLPNPHYTLLSLAVPLMASPYYYVFNSLRYMFYISLYISFALRIPLKNLLVLPLTGSFNVHLIPCWHPFLPSFKDALFLYANKGALLSHSPFSTKVRLCMMLSLMPIS